MHISLVILGVCAFGGLLLLRKCLHLYNVSFAFWEWWSDNLFLIYSKDAKILLLLNPPDRERSQVLLDDYLGWSSLAVCHQVFDSV